MKAFLLSSLCFFILVSGYVPTYAPSSGKADENGLRIIKEGFNKENPEYNYQMNISYPVVSINEPDIDYELNLAIQRIMSGAIKDFQNKVRSEKEKSDEGYNYLTVDYNICRQHTSVVSVRFLKITHYVGAPHSSMLYLSLNYDLKRKHFITLENIFKPEVDYKSMLMTLINESPEHCDVRNPRLLGNFCVEDNELVITLNNSNNGRKECPEEYRVSWSKIGPLLAEDGIGYELWQKL